MAGFRPLLSLTLLLAAAAMPASAQEQIPLDGLRGVRVASMRIAAEHSVPAEALPPIATLPGRPFDPRVFEEDLKRLAASGQFMEVRPAILFPESGGIDIVLDVVDLRPGWRPLQPRLEPSPLTPPNVRFQSPDAWGPPPIEQIPKPKDVEAGQNVVDVRIVGNDVISHQKIQAQIRTRVDRPFDRDVMNDDVRRLVQSRMFLDVKGRAELALQGGVIVTFTIVERPLVKEVKFLGNKKIKTSALAKEADLKVGSPLDPYSVDDARQRIEDMYKKKGINNTRVEVLEGNQPGDRRAVFLINEGVQQCVWWVTFEGNTIVTSARLRTQIQSKPPIAWIFKGYVDRQKIDADVDKLTAYYRSLGYFSARVGRELEWNEKESWLTLHFVIDEGPRYKVRDISVAGNLKFGSEQLMKDVQLKAGEFFDQPKMNADVVTIQDVYGSQGYIFANVQPETKFLEEPGQLDLVYTVEEGKRYRVGRIDVKITGEHPHTRIRTVLNRMSLRPGDIVDTRELRNSERRLKASQLFNVDPSKGVSPKIVLVPKDEDGKTADKPRKPTKRGQSPDPPGEFPPGPPAGVIPPGNVPPGFVPPGNIPPRMEQPPPRAQFNQQSGLYGRSDEYAVPTTQYPVLSTQYPAVSSQPAIRPSAQHSNYPEQAIFRGQSPDNNTVLEWRSPSRPRPPEEAPQQQPAPVQAAMPAAQTPPRQAPRYPTQPNQYGAQASQYPLQQPRYAPPARAPYQSSYSPTIIRGQSPVQGGSPVYTQPAPGPQYGQPPQYSLPPATGGMQFGGPPAQPGLGPPLQPGAVEQIAPGPMTGPVFAEPDEWVNIQPTVEEARTGRLMFGVGVNSDAGVIGNVVLEEQNFDFMRWPNSWYDFVEGSAFRGAGQRFRIEAVPGTQVQRYMFNFTEPYLFDTPVTFGTSAFVFTRRFRDWSEDRYGGEVRLGYQITPDLSVTLAQRAEDVDLNNPRTPTPPEVQEVVGHTDVYKTRLSIAHDTRDNTFLPTEGHYIELAYEQAYGEFFYPRATIDLRQFFLVRQRPDGSGRHVIQVSTQLGYTGPDTPVFDNFFAGGTTTLRGFRFRGASPTDLGTQVGGQFQFLGTVEYLAPVTADDALRAVFFCDFGTVEKDIHSIVGNDFRVAPGFGLRISVPALGPAPIALDLAFPIAHADGDQIQNFSFRVGLFR